MKRSPNQIRAMRRNQIRGRLLGARGALQEVQSKKDIFSDEERTNARIALKFITILLKHEPRNYIKTRYPTGK